MEMNKLKSKKITLSTLKSFAKKYKDNLYIIEISSFNGMSDMVEKVDEKKNKNRV